MSSNTIRTYTIGYPFGGSGVGASGSDAALVTLNGESATFHNVGGIDFDAEACRDFQYLTGAPSLCANIAKMTPEELRAFWGPRAPDVVKGSPPCKAGSGLLPLEVAASDEYQEMNRLMLVFTRLLFAAYPEREQRPRLAIFENVPSLLSATRARKVVDDMVSLWEGAGYRVDVRVHDLGEEGGLAQRRRRLAIICRDTVRCPAPVEMPPAKPLKSVGDVLGPLAWPDDPKAGPMHRLPRLSWVNMVRLALIGIDWKDGRTPKWDWRDLPPRGGVVEWLRARSLWPANVGPEGRQRLEEALLGAPSQKRNEVHRRQPVQPWGEPSPTVTGPGGGGLVGVQDPRVLESISEKREGRSGFMQVGPWDAPSATVTARTEATAGQSMGAVADPRVLDGLALTHQRAGRFADQYRVQEWNDTAATVTGRKDIQEGAPIVADPRVLESLAEGKTGDNAADWNGRPGYRSVCPWDKPSATVNGSVSATGGQGMGAIADERVLEQLGLGCECRNGFYGVLRWDRTSGTVTASLQVDCGTAAVADPREVPLPRPVISLALALQLLAEGWEVPKGALAPAILAPDNTWHRPLTTLELARLQGLPAVLNGKPLVLAGKSDRRWREHIGNGIPRDAAEAWGRQLLESLLLSDQGHSFRLLGGDLWVAPDMEVLAS
jgi:site-specific DNA-cytosine methylase